MGPATEAACACPRVDRIKAAAKGIRPADRRFGPAHADQCVGGSCVSGTAGNIRDLGVTSTFLAISFACLSPRHPS
jgi:hypothetical protein